MNKEVVATAYAAPEPATWPELLYRFVEHYKWQPQDLGIGKGEKLAVFYDRIRRQEVPLNYLFSLLLSLLSPDGILEVLKPFQFKGGSIEGERLHLCPPYDAGYTQPDIWLQSEQIRVFVELKWDARIKLDQVQKYLLLHADMDIRSGYRRPYLLFLSADAFKDCWRPRRLPTDTTPDARFLDEIVNRVAVPPRLAVRVSVEALQKYAEVKSEIAYGFSTWADICRVLTGLTSSCAATGSRNAETYLIRDFVRDLERRLASRNKRAN